MSLKGVARSQTVKHVINDWFLKYAVCLSKKKWNATRVDRYSPAAYERDRRRLVREVDAGWRRCRMCDTGESHGADQCALTMGLLRGGVGDREAIAAAATALEVLLFDSNNTPVLGVSDEQLAEIAAAKAEERGWDPDSSKESYYRSSLHDMRSVVTLLARLFSGATDLRAEAVNGAVERVLQDFHATVDAAISTHLAAAAAAAAAAASSGDSDGCDGDDATQPEAEAWHLWLKERQPPPVLRSGLLATVERWGKGWLSDQNRAELRVWAERAIAFSRWHESERSERVAEPAAEETAAETAVAKARAIAGLAEVAEAILAAL